MNPKSEFKVLEMNLSGADLIVGTSQLYKYDMVRDLTEQGVTFDGGPSTAHKSGAVGDYLSRHISGGRNYAILDGSVSLESQFKKTSVVFNYMHPVKSGPVYLQARSISDIQQAPSPSNRRKIGVGDLDGIVKEEGVRYASLPPKFYEIFRTGAKSSAAGAKPTASRGEENGWGELFAEGYEPKFEMSAGVKSPKMRFGAFENFPLAKLEETFTFPKQQRRASRPHVTKMAEAMAKGEFFDNVLNLRKVGKKWEVEDGKQTLYALRLLRDKRGLTHYNIYYEESLDGTPVKITRNSNKNRHNNPGDRSQVEDDETLPFYNHIRPYASHYREGDKVRFVEMGKAHLYATEGTVKISDANALERMRDIGEADSRRAADFLNVVVGLTEEKGAFIRRQAVISNLYKAFREFKMNGKTLASVVGELKKDGKVLELSRGISADDYSMLSHIVLTKVKKVA